MKFSHTSVHDQPRRFSVSRKLQVNVIMNGDAPGRKILDVVTFGLDWTDICNASNLKSKGEILKASQFLSYPTALIGLLYNC